MTLVEGLALTVAVLILLETVVLILVPKRLLKLSRTIANHKYTVMVGYAVLGAVLVYGLLQNFTLIEILGVGTVIAILYSVTLMPYYDELVAIFEEDYEEGQFWNRLWFGLSVWVLLAVAVISEWWYMGS